MSFHVGQKVVCVDDGQRMKNKIPANRWIKQGVVYVVRNFGKCPYKPWRVHGAAVWLDGIIRGADPNWPDFPFEANRFRPVTEKKTEYDISIFTDILDRVNKTQREPVSDHRNAGVPTTPS